MGALKNHPGMWLRDDAADAINALEDKYGKIIINSAGRTVAEQQSLINRWNKGGAANRPPNLYMPAMPAASSNHVTNGGVAIDVYNFTSDRAKLNEFGFEWYGTSDPVHYTFVGRKSKPSNAKPKQWNPFGIAYCAGLQKIARFGGYRGEIDQIWGRGSAAGFAQWLRNNWGYRGNDVLGPVMWKAIQLWLKTNKRWNYTGKIDGIPGPLTRAALQKAETANYRELP